MEKTLEQSIENYRPRPAQIQSVTNLTEKEKVFKMRFKDKLPLGHQPGQFVEVSVFGVGEAPISISSSPTRQDFELCIRNAGELTNIIHQMNKGQFLGIRGPYGSGFPIEKLHGKNLLFIAGGLGLAPLRSMIEYSLDKRNDFGQITILYGTRSPGDILYEKELLSINLRKDVDLHMTVDVAEDWWYGNVGVITTLFSHIDIDPKDTTTLICGPPIMYKFVLKKLLAMQMPEENIYMSLERRMKCGLGKCGHCQINNVYVCQDGPVFWYPEIKDKKEAL